MFDVFGFGAQNPDLCMFNVSMCLGFTLNRWFHRNRPRSSLNLDCNKQANRKTDVALLYQDERFDVPKCNF